MEWIEKKDENIPSLFVSLRGDKQTVTIDSDGKIDEIDYSTVSQYLRKTYQKL